MKPRTELYRCKRCGCVDIEIETWISMNTKEDRGPSDFSKIYCNGCATTSDMGDAALEPGEPDPVEGFRVPHDSDDGCVGIVQLVPLAPNEDPF